MYMYHYVYLQTCLQNVVYLLQNGTKLNCISHFEKISYLIMLKLFILLF